MTPIFTYLTGLFLVGAMSLGLWDLMRRQRLRGWLLISLALAVTATLFFAMGFPTQTNSSFGPSSPLVVFGLMLISVIAGVFASYVFEHASTFSWQDAVRPTVTAPLILLPLIGSIDARSTISETQLIFLVLVAFQNGFFWKIVLRRASQTAQADATPAGTKVG